jgi:hypothetical protein
MNQKLTMSSCFVATILASSLLLTGCATVETQSFVVNKDSTVQSAQIAANADFSKYDRLLAEEMGIFFPQNSPSTDEDVQHIRQIFRTAFIAELQGYDIVQQPGPTTMAVQASLIDLRNTTGAPIPGMRREIRDVATPGSLVFLMEMKDSRSNAVLARAADSAKAPTFASSEALETDWSSVEEAAQHWAALFRQFLDQNLSR